MAGTFPGVCNTQQNDLDGLPLSGGQLYVFTGGTTTLAQTWQDIGLSIPAQNPLEADGSGRIPLFFVADGTYRVRLTDQFGSTANGGFDYPQVPSIGASSSGGGGSAVDPSTIAQTGDWKWRPSQDFLAGWVRLNGKTIGSAVSGASERADPDTLPLYSYAWNTYPNAKCPVIGGRGVSAAADFAANKQLTLLDMRGKGPFGLDDMGNVPAGALVGAKFNGADTATTLAGQGGEGATKLTIAGVPTGIYSDPGHTHKSMRNSSAPFNFTTSDGGGTIHFFNDNVQTDSSPAGIIDNAGNGTHNTMPPFMLGTHYWKL